MKLIDKAKLITSKSKLAYVEEDFELVKEYILGNITLAQVKRAKDMPTSGITAYCYIATVLHTFGKLNRIKFK